jgi:Ca-activated chloride channel family protein
MSEVLHRFAHPWVFTLLGLVPFLGVAAFLARRRGRRVLASFGSSALWKPLVSRRRGVRTLQVSCLTFGILLLVAGSAGPHWGFDWDQPAAPGRDVVAVLDMSRSMLARDVLPNRFERAKQALEDLSYSVEQRGGHRLALVVFAGRARIVCPLTHDYDHFRLALRQQDAAYPGPELMSKGEEGASGTRIGAGLRAAVEAHDPRSRGYQDILLLSDGDDPVRDGEWREGVRAANEYKIVVHTVGVGDAQASSVIPVRGDEPLRHNRRVVTTRLVEEPLREIARLTGGTYTPAGLSALPLGELFRERIETAATREDKEDALPQERQQYSWFFLGAFILLGFEVLLGGIRPRGRAMASGPMELS